MQGYLSKKMHTILEQKMHTMHTCRKCILKKCILEGSRHILEIEVCIFERASGELGSGGTAASKLALVSFMMLIESYQKPHQNLPQKPTEA
jgi:hypothetical protein